MGSALLFAAATFTVCFGHLPVWFMRIIKSAADVIEFRSIDRILVPQRMRKDGDPVPLCDELSCDIHFPFHNRASSSNSKALLWSDTFDSMRMSRNITTIIRKLNAFDAFVICMLSGKQNVCSIHKLRSNKNHQFTWCEHILFRLVRNYAGKNRARVHIEWIAATFHKEKINQKRSKKKRN